MSNQVGTPITDADAFWIKQGEDRKQYQGGEYVRACIARQLETSLALAQEQITGLKEALKLYGKHGRECMNEPNGCACGLDAAKEMAK